MEISTIKQRITLELQRLSWICSTENPKGFVAIGIDNNEKFSNWTELSDGWLTIYAQDDELLSHLSNLPIGCEYAQGLENFLTYPPS